MTAFIIVNPRGGAATRIPRQELGKKGVMLSVLMQRIREQLSTDDSKTVVEWGNGRDLCIAHLFPRDRYSSGFLRQQAKQLATILKELGIVNGLRVHQIDPRHW